MRRATRRAPGRPKDDRVREPRPALREAELRSRHAARTRPVHRDRRSGGGRRPLPGACARRRRRRLTAPVLSIVMAAYSDAAVVRESIAALERAADDVADDVEILVVVN